MMFLSFNVFWCGAIWVELLAVHDFDLQLAILILQAFDLALQLALSNGFYRSWVAYCGPGGGNNN